MATQGAGQATGPGTPPPTKRPVDHKAKCKGGHVFVVLGDIRRLACSAWLVSAGMDTCWLMHWLPPFLTPDQTRAMRAADDEFRRKCWRVKGKPTRERFPRVRRVDPWLELKSNETIGQPYLCNVSTHSRDDSLDFLLSGVEEFFKMAAKDCAKVKPRRRAKHLFALPLVGTGAGGAIFVTGTVIKGLLPLLRKMADEFDVDIALTTNEPAVYATIHETRNRLYGDTMWDKLGYDKGETRRHARTLAKLARTGKLVLFLGAGVSYQAGLPLWVDLLEDLGKDIGLSKDERIAFKKMSVLDHARLLAKRVGALRLNEMIAKRLKMKVFSLQHALLSALPVNEIVTTNYDHGFEMASITQSKRISILPYEMCLNSDRWLLKMHGCTSHPEDIVLTRDDFIRYDSGRAALAGVVQSLLITKHMCFCGYSLNDENFHRVMSAVQQSLEKIASSHSVDTFSSRNSSSYVRFSGGGFNLMKERQAQKHNEPTIDLSHFKGSSLNLVHDPTLSELWRSELNMLDFCTPPGTPEASDYSVGARRLEIFLDCVASEAVTSTAHVLTEKLSGALVEEDRKFATMLSLFASNLPASARGPAFVNFVEYLRSHMGGEQLAHLVNTSLLDEDEKRRGTERKRLLARDDEEAKEKEQSDKTKTASKQEKKKKKGSAGSDAASWV